MIPDGYRVLLNFDAERERFVAQVPELDRIRAEGATRAEALTRVEEAIEAAFRQAAESGKSLPKPVDAQEWSGDLALKVSASLHRDLAFQARQDGVELPQLCGELLSQALLFRLGQRRPPQGGGGEERQEGGGGRRGEHGNRRGGRGRGRGDYFNIMDDRAAFIDYVRSIGTEGGGGRSRGGRGGRKNNDG
jgi:predicted RNase H-like HicB family nuclease